jgi:crotonobetainyl-CoA:carnitine CoA-transferase CaiB-like acyl-CoA transferase
MLAKLGADVIQVEPPGGSPARRVGPFARDASGAAHSLYWEAYAAGKRGITCNPAHATGLSLLHRLVAQADFLIESEDPDSALRRILNYDTLKALNPRLVHVSITAFGSQGPKSRHAASDLTIWAAGGPLLQTREPGKTPLRVSVGQSWLHAAADAAGGALIAHFARLASGQGQHVDISAQQSVAQATLSSILSAAVGHEDFSIRPAPKSASKKAPDLSGSGARTRRSKWQVRDGLVELHLAMGPAAGRFTNNLFAWMREEGACDASMAAWDWVTIPERIANDELDDDDIERAREAVGRFLAARGKQDLVEQAIRRKVLLAPVATVEDLVQSPHHAARHFFQAVDGAPDRAMVLPGAFAVCTNGGFLPTGAAPLPGQHNVQVYGSLCGMSPADLEHLQRAGVI